MYSKDTVHVIKRIWKWYVYFIMFLYLGEVINDHKVTKCGDGKKECDQGNNN